MIVNYCSCENKWFKLIIVLQAEEAVKVAAEQVPVDTTEDLAQTTEPAGLIDPAQPLTAAPEDEKVIVSICYVGDICGNKQSYLA